MQTSQLSQVAGVISCIITTSLLSSIICPSSIHPSVHPSILPSSEHWLSSECGQGSVWGPEAEGTLPDCGGRAIVGSAGSSGKLEAGRPGWGGGREGQGPSTAPSSEKLVTLSCARSAVQLGAFSPDHAPHSAPGFMCDSLRPHRPLGVGGVAILHSLLLQGWPSS